MMVCGFPHSMAHRKFPCVAWIIIMDKVDKPCLLQATGRPFKSRDLALSREVNRQGQRNRAIHVLLYTIQGCLYYVRFLLQNMCISSHCTIAEHAYGTCLYGYAHFSSLFLCAINVAIWGKLKSKRFEI